VRNFILGFVVTIVFLLIGAIAFLRLGAADVRADVHAPGWQRGLVQFAVHASVRRSAPRLQSPLAHTDAELIDGGKLYLNACAGCHGRPGGRQHARKWFLPPPEFAYVGTQYSEPELFWIIQHGIRRSGMSAYGPSFTEPQLWTLAEFVGRMKDLPPPVVDAIQPKKP
jgi:mono/diheme cytochrome c family protein